MRKREETLKKEVASRKGSQTVEGSQSNISSFEHKSFTTKPKLRKLTFHRQQTVRNRVYALQESFYPTKDVRYEAAKTRMQTLLGIVDRISILSYLGRPETVRRQKMDQTVQYVKSGTTVQKRHLFTQKLPAKKGYIELFGVGYVYSKNGEWFVHWNHKEQLTLSESEEVEAKSSKENLSLTNMRVNKHSTPNNKCEHSREKEKRESYSKCDINCDSESIQRFHGKVHNIKVKVFGDSHG